MLIYLVIINSLFPIFLLLITLYSTISSIMYEIFVIFDGFAANFGTEDELRNLLVIDFRASYESTRMRRFIKEY